jgi:hypothetical protein
VNGGEPGGLTSVGGVDFREMLFVNIEFLGEISSLTLGGSAVAAVLGQVRIFNWTISLTCRWITVDTDESGRPKVWRTPHPWHRARRTRVVCEILPSTHRQTRMRRANINAYPSLQKIIPHIFGYIEYRSHLVSREATRKAGWTTPHSTSHV